MQFNITVVNIDPPATQPTKTGKTFQFVEVAYKKDGKLEGKKIVSFSNPNVFKTIQQFQQGDELTVEAEKDANGYWQWTSVTKASEAPQTAASTGGGTPKTTGGNWETKEERAARQVMIVRQSSISSAVALLGNKAKASDVIVVAKEFESYVMGTEPKSAVQELIDMDDDIPL